MANQSGLENGLKEKSTSPIVRVHQTKPADYRELSMFECSILGDFPQAVNVSWLRDGMDVTTDVLYTDILANGDWSFQFHS
ncbi:DLA class II histocompatibility antigen, DR-1 beta chain-like [Mastacembelus armatus]|uniref:DLA class II histocompatibility antigen, DR-1 beta chain-like n=1 Tax=Mastacembelus armatus TaxID=205130 RepID=UPI001436921F|nr:DLA class II histocompatibility antigen, DR-1 beta chain-like [Mastacembelus armatus]